MVLPLLPPIHLRSATLFLFLALQPQPLAAVTAGQT
jgi:hypothetical protein